MEYNNMSDWVGKMFHWELCKRLRFDYAERYYWHKPKSVLLNETHKIPCVFEIKINHPIQSENQT